MTPNDESRDELETVVERLRMHRSEATPLELDAVKQRVRARMARRPRARRKAEFMRSRVAILTTLVLGMMLSTTGAGLAVTGWTDNQASVAQYPPPPAVTPPKDEDIVLPEDNSGNLPKGEEKGTPPAPKAPVQETRQVQAGVQSSGNLPFTGFAAIPVLLLGLALVAGGLVMRRSARQP